MTAPDPRANPILLGHQAAEATLADAWRSGRLHHAWLLVGPPGIGKATLAFRFARRLLAGPPGPTDDGLALDPAHPVFRRVAAGAHADLLTVELAFDPKRKRQRTEIVVDDVRAITGFLHLTPAEAGWRVVVVDGADELNRNAGNALLKVLEEPPPRAVLLLTAAAPGRLPPTIRSRTRRLRLAPLGEADMTDLLARYLPDIDPVERGRLAAIAEGAPGRALQLAEEEGVKLAGLVDEILAALPELPPLRPYDIADQLGRSDTAFSTFMDLLRAAIAAALRDSLRGRGDAEQRRLAGVASLEAWGETWHALTRMQEDAERFSLDRRQTVISGLFLLRNMGAGTPR